MAASFIDSLPSDLRAHVSAGCGVPGTQWLEGLEATVRKLESRWAITVSEPFPAIEFNFVAPAVTENGDDVVLKIAPPWDPVEIFGEAEYLRSREGIACIKLLAVDRETKAILLERVFPGANFAEHFHDRKTEVIEPAIQVLKEILRPVPNGPHGITTLDKWFDGLRRHVSTDFPRDYAVNALEIYDRLSRQTARIFYLHGDYHPGNVLTAERSPYLAIDPKGIIGHVGYDIAVFLNNFHWWQQTEPRVKEILDVGVRQFADAFEIDAFELREWSYAQMVIGSWWNFVDMPELYDGGVVKADIWEV